MSSESIITTDGRGVTTPRPKVILFDLWKTIARGPYPEPIAELRQILGLEGKVDPEHFLRVCLTTPYASEAEYLQSVCGRFGIVPPADALSQFEKVVRTERNGVTTYPDVRDAVAALKARGYRIGLVSNSWIFPLAKLLGSKELLGCFEHVITSAQARMAKQEGPAIYHLAAQTFGVRADECCMVGDNPALDVVPALQAGAQAVLIDRHEDYLDEHGSIKSEKLRTLPMRAAIRTLDELPAVFE